jgi:hypothetical protein
MSLFADHYATCAANNLIYEQCCRLVFGAATASYSEAGEDVLQTTRPGDAPHHPHAPGNQECLLRVGDVVFDAFIAL